VGDFRILLRKVICGPGRGGLRCITTAAARVVVVVVEASFLHARLLLFLPLLVLLLTVW